ncbi:MAG: IclR family transcriptional regulator [Acidimicrobiia bacterium]|nr:IclR family transcriptional regulator [Acidimicrobiia bacterium]
MSTVDGKSTTHSSLRRAISIMRAFSEPRPSMTVTELANDLNLHKSTVSRILATLLDEGLVYQHPDSGRYSLGLGLVTMSAVAVGQSIVRSAALPHLDRLVSDCGETAVLSVMRGGRVVTLATRAPSESIRYVTWEGRALAPQSAVAGRTLLAGLSRVTRDELVQDLGDEEHEDLDELCKQGLDAERDNIEVGMSSVTAPVRDHLGGIVAALSVVGPTTRFDDRTYAAAWSAVRAAAADTSSQLGFEERRPGVA